MGKKFRENTSKTRGKRFTVCAVMTFLLLCSAFAIAETSAQTAEDTMTANILALYKPLGLNQTQIVRAVLFPRPIVTSIYYNLTFSVVKPDKTTQTIVVNSDEWAQYDLEYVCNQLGTYSITLKWGGDVTHPKGCTSAAQTWTVQQESVPTAPKVKTYAYASTSPSAKVGTGQALFVAGWVTPLREVQGGAYKSFLFEITKPDGTKTTKTVRPDTAATAGFMYRPDQVGSWSIKMSYDGDIIHTSCTSPVYQFAVTKEPQLQYGEGTPQEPVPNGEWTYPISGEYREWYQISGSWVQKGADAANSNFNEYTQGPRSAHILWKQSALAKDYIGGLYGGSIGHLSDNKPSVQNMIASHGRLYFTRGTDSGISGQVHPVLYCLNQYTGEVIYTRELPGNGTGNNLAIDMSPDLKIDPKLEGNAGAIYRLWIWGGSLWQVDPWTGSVEYYWDKVSPSLFDKGNFYISNYPKTGNLTKWNTRAITPTIAWTVQGSAPSLIWNDLGVRRISSSGGYPRNVGITTMNMTTGEIICVGPDTGAYSSEGNAVVADGMYFFHSSTERCVYALDLLTGKVVWKSEPWSSPWGCFGAYDYSAGYNSVVFGSYDGYLYCYNNKDGSLKWKAFSANTSETGTGVYGWWGQPVIGGGMVYAATGEHTVPNPPPRGNTLYAVDAFTGKTVWSYPGFLGFQNAGGISSGMMWYLNHYDTCFYMFGRGPTATQISTSPAINGGGVVIQGTVTDQSAGAKGTPCVSQESMTSWMQHIYNNKPAPTNTTGVPVLLQIVKPDRSTTDLTHVTTDANGQFSYLWVPPSEGKYTVIAKFEGDESYYSSKAETAFGLMPKPSLSSLPSPAPSTTNPYTAQPTQTSAASPIPNTVPPTSEAPATVYIAIGTAVVIMVVAATAIALRRRK